MNTQDGYCKHCGEVRNDHVDLKCPFDATTYEFGSPLWEDIRKIITENSMKDLQESEDRMLLKVLEELNDE